MSNTYHGDPQDYVLINEAVEVLVEEEEARAYEGCVWEVQLTLGHVCDLKRHRSRQHVQPFSPPPLSLHMRFIQLLYQTDETQISFYCEAVTGNTMYYYRG